MFNNDYYNIIDRQFIDLVINIKSKQEFKITY